MEEMVDLSASSDEDLLEQIHDDLYDGLADGVVSGTEVLLSRGWSASRVLERALVEGMQIVGADFREGVLFVPEVLLAANAGNDENCARWISANRDTTGRGSSRRRTSRRTPGS